MVECNYETGKFYLDVHEIDDLKLPDGLKMEEYEVYPRKKYKISDLIELWLVINDTFIVVGEKVINMCKRLAITLDEEMLEATRDLDDLDDIIYVTNNISPKFKRHFKTRELVSGEEEFWAHCSNVQAWYDMGYDMRVIDSRLGARILKAVSDAGDPDAKMIFQAQMRDRLDAGFVFGNTNVISVALNCKWALDEIAGPEWWDRAFNKLPNDDKIREFAKLILYYKDRYEKARHMIPRWVLDVVDEMPDHLMVRDESEGNITRLFINLHERGFRGKENYLEIWNLRKDAISLPKGGPLVGVKRIDLANFKPSINNFAWILDMVKEPREIESFQCNNTGISSADALNRLENVLEISIIAERNLTKIPYLPKCKRLVKLSLRRCINLETTGIPGDLPALKSLCINNFVFEQGRDRGVMNSKISIIEGINHLNSIQELSLAWNRIETIDGVRGMENLRVLDLSVNRLGDLDLDLIHNLPRLECILLHSNLLDGRGIDDKFLELASIPNIKKFSCDKYVYGTIKDQMLENGWQIGRIQHFTNLKQGSGLFFRNV
ncbi:MAG: leucine-rich repeat domain-containing protein [Promethearchaeota archaeon]